MQTLALNNGVEMPALGLGVFRTPPDETQAAVRAALDPGHFAAEHKVTADIELIGAQDVNAAYERINASDVRHRFVIDASNFTGPTA
ncbi:hypothetical protein [Streptomyces sp. NPDC048185]|uniref:hypothetical protein n=1 Tax=Streptomyces sp. NPDC048185 TaxID=3365508 RepID=UPI00371AE284